MNLETSFLKHNRNGIIYSTAPTISTLHAFTTRAGGVSSGPFASLNLSESCGDDLGNVQRNYDILFTALGISTESLVVTHQIHGTEIRVVSRDDLHRIGSPVPYDADGLITNLTGVTLMIFTADCTPILLHDPNTGCIGAVHAGWRGTAAGIAMIAVQKMVEEFGSSPGDICAAIGPCISKCCFETDIDVPDALHAALGIDAEGTIEKHGSKYYVDLKKANRQFLLQAGLDQSNISISDECTMCLSDVYWSHRKTGGIRGTQASLITLG